MMKEFARRRRRLMQMMGRDSIAILPTAPLQLRNRDVEYPYRPDSDFYYLTGFPEPRAVLVLLPGRGAGEYILFCQERDPKMERWTGSRAGQEGACELYGADDAFPIGDIDEILPGLMENREKVFYTMGGSQEYDHKIPEWLKQIRQKSRAGIQAPGEIVSLDHLLHEMRLFKSRREVSLMRRAAKISATAHVRAMQCCRPGLFEYHLEAELIATFMRNGCRHTAYPPIVGGGANACVLHYTANDAELKDGDLVLIDAGAELDNYAADITRTFPVNGCFTPAQREIYELVLAAQEAAIAKIVPGNHWQDPHHAAVRVLTRGLRDLGLLRGDLRTLLKKEACKRFFMHRTGHWLGMDVHDVGDYQVGGVWRLLEPGMVMTVEPGLYIPAGSRGVAKKWWNIGVRIEDDVLVTRHGCDVLSKDAPKTVAAIERLMATAAGEGG